MTATRERTGRSASLVDSKSTRKRVVRVCKDCLVDGVVGRRRPAPHPGPRCYTHHRAVKSSRSAKRKATHVEDNYGITEEEYQLLLKAQDGRCYNCKRKPGKKRLDVDHDHKCTVGHEPNKGCRKCVRGLLCGKCNRYLGWIRDDPAAMDRGAVYLRNPPARAILGED